MTDHDASLNTPQPWVNPPTVGLWGPPLPNGAAPQPARHAPRPRKPWGLGDVGWAFGVLLVTQMLLVVVYVVWAALTVDLAGKTPAQAVQAVTDQMTVVTMSGPGSLLGLLTEWMAFLGVPYWAAKRKGLGSLAADFGLRFRRYDVLLGLGLAGTMQAVLYGLQQVLSLLGADVAGSDNVAIVTGHTGVWLVVMAACAAVGAPVSEEVFFRGLMLRALLRRLAKMDLAAATTTAETVSRTRIRWGVAASVAVSAWSFGIMHTPVSSDPAHPVSLSGTVTLAAMAGLLGAVFACVAVKTRRLGPTIWAHVIFNSTSVALALLATH